MKSLLGISNAIDTFVGWIEVLCLWLISALVLLGVWNVLTRQIDRYLYDVIGRNLASNTLIEGQWYLFSVVFLLGFAVIMRRNQHVRVDFLFTKQTPRRRALINLLGTLFMLFPFCALAIFIAWDPVVRSWGFMPNGRRIPWEMSPDPGGLPRAPLKSMIIVGFALLALQGVSDAIKHAVAATAALSEEEIAALEAYEAKGID
jgi:TRAP-type mannitol/chloroaromatic compound transport system permease small subunit